MKNLNAEIFKKNQRGINCILLFTIIFLLISIILVYLGFKNINKPLPTPISLNSLIKEKNNETEKYAYVDINTKPYLFAVYEVYGEPEDNQFYLVMDKDKYLYIIYMNEDKFNELNIDDIKDNPQKIFGITKLITNELKNMAISSYNESINQEQLTNDNFNDFVGYLYLDMVTPINNSFYYFLGASISLLLFLISLISYLVIIIKNKKVIKNIPNEELYEIDTELSELRDSKYKKMKFFMLKYYIVYFNKKIIILKYSDIIWAYPYLARSNGLLINEYIKVVTINNKKYKIASVKVLNKNKDKILEEILNKLKEKNENIILNYSYENKEKVKEIIKDNKKIIK